MRSRILLLAAVLSPVLTLHAIVDTNDNGLSDIWEKQFNKNELFSETFDPGADLDADGWTNAQEAAAGTDPFITAHPLGHLQPETVHLPETWVDTDNDNIPDSLVPESIQVSWPTIPGKQYTFQSNATLAPDNWINVGSPFIGAGTVVTYRFFTSAAAKTFWRVKIGDIDSNEDELNDAEEESIGTDSNLTDSDEDGIPDGWEAMEGLDPLNQADAQSDFDGDGLTNLEEFQGGTHTNEHDLIIIVEREIISSGSQVVESKDEEGKVTWDGFWSDGSTAAVRQSRESFANVISNRNSLTYHGDWSPAMSASELGQGGFWLHPDGLQAANHTYDLSHSDADGNEFRMTGHGASKFKIRLKRNQSNGPEMNQVYYVMVFTQGNLSEAAEFQPLNFTFAENQIYSTELEFKSDIGHAVIGFARPVVTAAFGLGPDAPLDAVPRTSRGLLEAYLNLIKIIRVGDVWAVVGKDSQNSPNVQLVEIATNQQKLNDALATRGQFVVFDGHSNYGLGPNFGGNDVSRLGDFTNYGDKYTDVPLDFQLRGSLSDPSKWGHPFKSLVVMHDEIPNEPINYKPVRIDSLRFPNIDGVEEDEKFAVDGQGINMWHYQNEFGEKRLLIKALNTDLPSELRYDTFFIMLVVAGLTTSKTLDTGTFYTQPILVPFTKELKFS